MTNSSYPIWLHAAIKYYRFMPVSERLCKQKPAYETASVRRQYFCLIKKITHCSQYSFPKDKHCSGHTHAVRRQLLSIQVKFLRELL